MLYAAVSFFIAQLVAKLYETEADGVFGSLGLACVLVQAALHAHNPSEQYIYSALVVVLGLKVLELIGKEVNKRLPLPEEPASDIGS